MNFFSNFKQYVKDSKAEFKKVIWPTSEEVVSGTQVVVVSVVLFSIFFGTIDYLLMKLVGILF